MYLSKTPKIIQFLFPGAIWKLDSGQKTVYLTFDDGPIPEVTPWVLEQLKNFHAEATFFCIGENVAKYPEIFEQVIKAGHAVGNHTYNHLNGWRTKNKEYYKNIHLASEHVETKLFRPPYGKLSYRQYNYLRRSQKIIMWDVISYDFDQRLTAEACIENVMKNTANGSIVVFHDSIKAWNRLEKTLPEVLQQLSDLGFSFRKLEL